MKRYRVRLTDEAETDIAEIQRYVRKKAVCTSVARTYVGRIRAFFSDESSPERGTVRANVSEGLRIVGFERASASPLL